MEILKVTIAKKSAIFSRASEPLNFGDMLVVKFNKSNYYFKVTEVSNFRNTKTVFFEAEQTGSSNNKLCDRIKGDDIAEFTKSECEILTDEEAIKNINQSACYC